MNEVHVSRACAIDGLHDSGHTPFYIEAASYSSDYKRVKVAIKQLLKQSEGLVCILGETLGKKHNIYDIDSETRTATEYEVRKFIDICLKRRKKGTQILIVLQWFPTDEDLIENGAPAPEPPAGSEGEWQEIRPKTIQRLFVRRDDYRKSALPPRMVEIVRFCYEIQLKCQDNHRDDLVKFVLCKRPSDSFRPIAAQFPRLDPPPLAVFRNARLDSTLSTEEQTPVASCERPPRRFGRSSQ